jgi:hypothetical protein
LNKAASDVWFNHKILFIPALIGRSPYADVPPGVLEFDDDEKEALVRVKLEDLKP